MSRLHRITSAEVWHFYGGRPLTVVEIAPDGAVKRTTLGADLAAGHTLQHVVPGGAWFGSHLAHDSSRHDCGMRALLPCGGSRNTSLNPIRYSGGAADEHAYALVGCTVAPGFDFADFELAQRADMLARFPHADDDIMRLTRAE